MQTKQISKIVKHVLSQRFGHYNVSVLKGKGTASGWINAVIDVTRPEHCCCQPKSTYCFNCVEQLKNTAEEARKIVYAEMKERGAEFMTYYSDTSNDPADCFSLQVHIKKS